MGKKTTSPTHHHTGIASVGTNVAIPGCSSSPLRECFPTTAEGAENREPTVTVG